MTPATRTRAGALLVLAAALIGGGGRAASDPGALTIDRLIQIKHPSNGTWSPDGRQVAFVWDLGGVQNVDVVDLASGAARAPRALTSYASGLVGDLFWTRDGRHVAFARDGDLWRVPSDGSAAPQRVWAREASGDGFTPSPDGTRVAFARAGDLFVRTLDGRETRLTSTPGVNETGPVWSPDGSRLAFTSASAARRAEAPPFSGAKIVFTWFERSLSDVEVVPAAGGRVVPVAAGPDAEGSPRWIDGSRLLVQRISADYKTREILAANAGGGPPAVVHRDSDPVAWSLTYLNPDPQPSPDGQRIAFLSDRDGWDHLYVVPSRGGTAMQLTDGRYEVRRFAWSPDSRRLAFDSNEGSNPGARQLAVIDAAGGAARALTTGRGTNIEPRWSPDGRRLLYQHTDPRNSADLFVVDAPEAGRAPTPVRLSDSMPSTIDKSLLVAPEFVRFPSRDGRQVPAYLFIPRDLDRSRKHPAIVWVHGDGVTQNFDGWHERRDYAVYYSFHQYLLQRGYVVLAVDYRGSIGYGRAWREGHFRDLGGKDSQDVAAGMDYLRGLGFVDPSRVGVWGLSYGGFLTLQALTVTPDLFRCGIDVAGVVDWRDWYQDPDGPWIKSRMGSPADNPGLYDRTAPIRRMDRLVRPLLVLHGTADVNVPFLESVRLIDVLTKLGKDVQFMMYPGEFHYFHRAHVLRDAWHRVEDFFDAHLLGPSPS